MISGWYPWHLAVGFGQDTPGFSNFSSFLLWPFSTDIWLIFMYIQLIFFNILPKSLRWLIEIWSIFSWYLFIILLISGWYPWYPDMRCADFQQGVTPCGRLFDTKACSAHLAKIAFYIRIFGTLIKSWRNEQRSYFFSILWRISIVIT